MLPMWSMIPKPTAKPHIDPEPRLHRPRPLGALPLYAIHIDEIGDALISRAHLRSVSDGNMGLEMSFMAHVLVQDTDDFDVFSGLTVENQVAVDMKPSVSLSYMFA